MPKGMTIDLVGLYDPTINKKQAIAHQVAERYILYGG